MITNEDCMDLMARYEDNYFDLAIVDPPYGIGISNAGGYYHRKGIGQSNPHKKKEWDNSIPSEEFFIELQRVSKDQIIWGGNYFTEFLHPSRCWIFWDKMKFVDNYADGELAWVSMDRNTKKVQIQHHGFLTKDGKSIHPTQKPVMLYEWILMNFATCKTCKNAGGYYEDVAGDGGSQMKQVCDDCDTHERPVRILDTHLGSGSIAIACHNLGFELTGCELDKDYYEAAMKRIEQHKQQQRLF